MTSTSGSNVSATPTANITTAPQKKTNISNIFEYITASVENVDQLYENVWACKAVFRSLSDLAKQYILRLTLSEGQTPIAKLTSMLVQENFAPGGTQQQPTKEAAAEHQSALQQLTDLKLITPVYSTVASGALSSIKLNPTFQATMRTVLTSPETVQTVSSALEVDKKPPSMSTLETYAKEKWEEVLKYIAQVSTDVSPGIKTLLEWSKLVRRDESTDVSISAEGFQFLLQGVKTQVWILLKEYLDTAQNRKLNKIEVMQFLFQLSFLEPGKDYPVEPLTITQKVMLVDLADFGLIYQRKSTSRRFYPTQLASNIVISDNSLLDWTNKGTGYIVIETNYRVYAYTSSPLEIAILSLFVGLEYRLPNLVVGMITRDSIRAALMNDISADQILGYLYVHAHPELKKRNPVLPEVVADQIKLWEHERNRLQMTDAVLYDKFPSAQAFRAVEEQARRNGYYLYSVFAPERMLLVCKREGHEFIKNFIKKHLG